MQADPGGGRYQGVPSLRPDRLQPDPRVPQSGQADVPQLKIDCQWMIAHVDLVLNVASLAVFMNPFTNQVVQVEEPPARPRQLLAGSY